MIVTITSEFEIAAAHFLPLHDGKCRHLHGHNYRIQCSRSGPVITEGPATGMVQDFSVFDTPIKHVLATLDHTLLNDSIAYPTAENLGLYLLEQLPDVEQVIIWETGRHYVTVTR